jgi:hypothetical protein
MLNRYLAKKQEALPNLPEEILQDESLIMKLSKYGGGALAVLGVYHGVDDILNQEYGNLLMDSFAVAAGSLITKASFILETGINQELERRQAPAE